MNVARKQLQLYAVTERGWLRDGIGLPQAVSAALAGGVTCLQLREKELAAADFLREAVAIRAITGRYRVPLIINDDVAVAIDCGADGVHVGQDDLAAGEVRRRIGDDMILGVSVQSVDQAQAAQRAGADYLGVGAVFTSPTKRDAPVVSSETLQAICAAVTIPVVAIGGITANNIADLQGSGIAGVALISAIFAQDDIEAAARHLRGLVERYL